MFKNYTAEKYNPKEFDYPTPDEGTYFVEIIDIAPPKEQEFGKECMVVKLMIIGDSEFSGSYINDRIYSIHPTSFLVKLGQHRLNGYCAALSKPKFSDIRELIGGKLKILFKPKVVQGRDKPIPDVKEYIKLTEEELKSLNDDLPF